MKGVKDDWRWVMCGQANQVRTKRCGGSMRNTLGHRHREGWAGEFNAGLLWQQLLQ